MTSPSNGAACSTQHAYRQQPSNGSCTQDRDVLLPTTVQDLDILEAACGTIQSAMRQRLARELPTPKQTKRSRLWAHGGSLPQPYIDIGSGASALGEMHSNENLVAHEAFRSQLVESALATAWRACAQGASTLVREAYYTMARKLYLSVTLHCGEEPDPYECLRRLEGEWTYYAGAKELLTQNEFARAWLRLAGMHATTVSAEVYAEWILSKVHTIANPNPNPNPNPTPNGSYLRCTRSPSNESARQVGAILLLTDYQRGRTTVTRNGDEWDRNATQSYRLLDYY